MGRADQGRRPERKLNVARRRPAPVPRSKCYAASPSTGVAKPALPDAAAMNCSSA